MPDGALIIGGAILFSTILNIVTREPTRVLLGGIILVDGESYLVRTTVTNQSIKADVPIEATLIVTVSASIDGVDLIPYDTWTELFAAGETRVFESVLNIPSGSAGMIGGIVANIFDPSDNLLDFASEDLVVEEIPTPPEVGLYGIVTDAETGAPLESVLVSIAAPYEQSTFTDVNGFYTFPLGTGNYTVYLNKDGYWVERVEVTLITIPHELNVELSLIELVGDYFVSCEVPAQIARGVIPPFGGYGATAEFWATHRVWLTAKGGLLVAFYLLVDKTGVIINPAEYAQPWYGVSEEDVLYLWNLITYLPTPAQLQQLFPVEADGFYEGVGVALWGADATPSSLSWNCSYISTFPWYVPPPRGIYKVISRCSVVPCSIEPGPTIRTWGSWVTLWEVDTGKTIEVV